MFVSLDQEDHSAHDSMVEMVEGTLYLESPEADFVLMPVTTACDNIVLMPH